MPQGDKSKYTDKQKHQAEHIEEGYEEKGLNEKEAAARAWATVNKESGGGKKAGGSERAKSSEGESVKKGKKKKATVTTAKPKAKVVKKPTKQGMSVSS